MRRLVLTALTLMTCGVIYSLPLGNPSEASLYSRGVWWNDCGCWSVRGGFYGDYVFDRHMRVESHHNHHDINDTEIFTNAGYFVLNVFDRADFFATLGASNIFIKTDARAWGILPVDDQGIESELHTETSLSWSIGGRATLWECCCFALGIEGQYFSTNPNLSHSVLYNDGAIVYFNNEEARYSEWQVGLGISYTFTTGCPSVAMVPYVGVKWSGSKFDLGNTRLDFGSSGILTYPDLESDNVWGYAVGMSFTLCDMLGVNAEGRFGDEKAVSVIGQIRF